MSVRIAADSRSLVVERPLSDAVSRSTWLAASTAGEDAVVVDGVGEPLKEFGDLFVVALGQRGKGINSLRHGTCHQLVLGGGDVQQIAGVLHDDQAIAGHERSGQLGRDHGAPIAAVDQHLALDQLSEPGHRSLCRGDLMAR